MRRSNGDLSRRLSIAAMYRNVLGLTDIQADALSHLYSTVPIGWVSLS
jgi:hypothetical protein